MDIIIIAVKTIHILVSILLIITVLLQPGKGDDLGTIFGGSSQSIFGASGAVPFLTKITRFLAVLFIITSLSLGYFSAKSISSSVVTESKSLPQEQVPAMPSEGQSSNKTETNINLKSKQQTTQSQGQELSSPQSEQKSQEEQGNNK
ncbi:MAG TPA: preprotein translocase subunit SecG [Thermodesulfobacteriota bacterium]